MFDIGWAELLVIGALALIVVGPEDLPGMLRKAGRIVARARAMAREFQGAMEDAAREADLKEVTDFRRDMSKWSSDLRAPTPKNIAKSILSDEKKDEAAKGEAAKPAAGSLDAADAAENAAWEREQAAAAKAAAHDAARDAARETARAEELRAAEAKAEAQAARLEAVNRSAAELEAEIARDEAAAKARGA